MLIAKINENSFWGFALAIRVLDTANKGKRVKIGLISNPSIYTDRDSTNLQIIQDDIKEEVSSGEETRHTSNKEKDKRGKRDGWRK